MKKINLFFAVLVGVFCLCTITFAGSGFKMVQSDHGETANLWLADQIEQSVNAYPPVGGRIADSRGATPLHFLKMLKDAGHYNGDLAGLPTYLRNLKWEGEPDRTKIFTLSRLVHTKQNNIEAWLDWKRKINTAGEGVFVDSKGTYVISGLCLNVIKKEIVEKPPILLEVLKKVSEVELCGCEDDNVVVKLPLKLHISKPAGKNEVLLRSGKKHIFLVEIRDANNRNVWLPDARITVTDINSAGVSEINYTSDRFDPVTCSFIHVKWIDWHKGDSGRLSTVQEVGRATGILSFEVSGFDKISYPWRVLDSKKIQAPEDSDVTGITFDNLDKGLLKGRLVSGKSNPDDRIVELFFVNSQKTKRSIAYEGKFIFQNIPLGSIQTLAQVLRFPVDKPEPSVEVEEIIFLE